MEYRHFSGIHLKYCSLSQICTKDQLFIIGVMILNHSESLEYDLSLGAIFFLLNVKQEMVEHLLQSILC